MSATLHHTEGEREAFEQFMSHSRRNKGVKKAAELLNKFDDGTYINDHVQRHWWTWQQATLAFNRPRPKTALSYFADDVEAAMAQESGWISVDERLPSHEQEVICTGFEGDDPNGKRWQEFAVFHEDGLFYDRDTGDDFHPPTHWRELLALPPAPNQGEAS